MVSRDVPLYPWQQVRALLLHRIESGQLPRGSRLPSINELSEQYGVAGVTVRKALKALREEGYIVTLPSYASFVSEHPPGNR